MKNSHNIPDQNDILSFELYLIKTAHQLFGFKKMFRFILGLSTIFFTKRNRSAYEFMGICKLDIDGKLVYWKHPDVRFIDEVIIRKCYIPSADFDIKDDYVVVDAGANVGAFTLYAASKATSGKIYAIEGDKNEFGRLVENIEINSFSNVETINAALTDIVGDVTFSDSHVQPLKTDSMTKSNYVFKGLCKSLTLTELINNYNITKIDFLKLDIEGSEFQVFKESGWLDKTQIIAMELHSTQDSDKTEKIVELLKLKNFSVNLVFENKTLYCYAKKQN